MNIYVVNILLIMLYSLIELNLYKKNNNNNKAKKALFVLTFFQMFFILTFRKHTLGADGEAYFNAFFRVKDISFQRIFDFNMGSPIHSFERGFIFLNKLISLFTNNYTVYLGILSLLILLPIFVTIRNYSKLPIFSIFLYISLNFMHFSISGLRQALAFSIIFYACNFLIKRKNFKFLVTVLIASSMHNSALIFLIVPLIIKIPINNLYVLIYTTTFVTFFIFREQILHLLTLLYYGSGRDAVNTESFNLLLVTTLLFYILLIYRKTILQKSPESKYLYGITSLAPILMILNTVSKTALRAANYFFIYMIILIPELLIRFERKNRLVLFIAMLLFLFLYYYFSGRFFLETGDYDFYWR